MKGGSNRLEHARRILKHVIVPETQDTETFPAKIGIALAVGITVAMLTAIRFDDQRSFEAGEVDDVRCDDVLAAEFGDRHAAVAEHGPEAALGRCGVRAHRSGAGAEFAEALALVV